MKTIVALTVAIAATATSAQAGDIGATGVPVGTSTFIAGLRGFRDGASACSGVLIHPKWILSTALCELQGDYAYANVGSQNFEGDADGTIVKVIRKIRPPSFYASFLGDDFGLFELEKEVAIKPVKLAAAGSAAEAVGAKGAMLGWATDNNYAKLLFQVERTVISKADCDTKMQRGVSDMSICAVGPADKETCEGQRGGPLVVNNNGTATLVGMMSYTWGCGYPNVYSRVSAGRAFIDKYVPKAQWM